MLVLQTKEQASHVIGFGCTASVDDVVLEDDFLTLQMHSRKLLDRQHKVRWNEH